MHKIKELCDKIEEAIKHEFDKGIQNVDTKEMGEVVDIYKDLIGAKKDYYEAEYYKQIVEAMEEYSEDDEEDGKMYYGGRGRRRASRDSRGRYTSRRGYDEMFPAYDDHSWTRDMDRDHGKMYYSGQGSQGGSMGGSQGGSQGGRMNYGGESGGQSNSQKTSRSEDARRGYMESKSMNKPESETKKELEDYMRELGGDMAELISKATPTEKATAKAKMQEIINKM